MKQGDSEAGGDRPAQGNGVSIAFDGGLLMLASPHVPTWPSSASGPAAAPGSMDGTGRVFAATFCWSGDVKKATDGRDVALPYVCSACATGERSQGGATSLCEDCAGRECIAPGRTWFNGTTPAEANITMKHGESYQMDVLAVALHGALRRLSPARVVSVWCL